MKIIFLDIDGVLNADCDFGGRSKPNPFVTDNYGRQYAGICITHLKVLKEIVDRTEAKIVLTSTWKNDYANYLGNHNNKIGKYLHNKFRKAGLSIYDTTCKYNFTEHENRGYEIQCYLEDHPNIENYIIIDDICFKDFFGDLIKHLYQTDEEYGLCDAEYPVYMLTGVKSEELIRREEQNKIFKEFATKLTENVLPNTIAQDLVIVKPIK